MQIRENQREAMRRDSLVSFIFLTLMMVVIGLRMIKSPLTVGQSILGFLTLLLLLALYLFSINPALLKTMRNWLQENPRANWSIPAGLYFFSLLYLLLAGLFSLDLFVRATIYCLLPAILIDLAIKKSQTVNAYDILIILALWLPIEFGLFARASVPPQHGITNFYHLCGLVFIIFFYFLRRELPQAGLTFHLKFKEVQLSIQNTLMFLCVALVLGVPTEFIRLSHSVPGFLEMGIAALSIFFFIALPEELLFRAVIQNSLEQRWVNRTNGYSLALIVASIIFGLAHANNNNPPFINIDLGSLGIWHFPWVYVVLATVAGFAYGWTFAKTRKVTAAALVHLLVDWVWSVFFNG